ncbi:hypothetical protein IDH15_00130 [Pelagibacterales bacterium SAG-MED38]|nr:hypothetical protein [Pelagibacterales bacterium SAG-MED38]
MELIKLFILLIILITTNFLFKSKNFLLSYTGLKHQTYIQQNKIPLSGGFVLLTYFLINHNDQNIILILYIFLFFLIGLIGDLNLFKSVILRFLIQIVLIIFFVTSLNISVTDLRLDFLNEILGNFYFNIFFISFCFLVLINGSNFIDGCNGLAIGYYLIIYIFLFYLNNNQIIISEINLFLSLIFCLLILLVFNLSNKLFLGDNGIYILSIVTGYILIEIVNSNKYISPYYIMNLLWYPAFEILFSMLRKIGSNFSPMQPDTNHLHQLLFFSYNHKFAFSQTMNNSLVGITINLYNLFLIFIFSIYPENSKFQLILVTINVINYLIVYKLLFDFKKKFKHRN